MPRHGLPRFFVGGTASPAFLSVVTALLAVDGLTITAPGAARPLIDGLSFEAGRGETLAVVGESGAGKSTAGLALLGLVHPPLRVTAGRVSWKGRDMLALPARELRAIRGAEIGFVFQEPSAAMNPAMPAGAQIAEVLRVHRGLGRAEANRLARAALARVRLADPERAFHALPHELSGGMLQRIGIALAIACGPGLLVADEPTTALDASVQRSVLELLAELQTASGMAMVFVTHDLALVAEMADRVLVLHEGRAVEQGSVLDVFEHPRTAITRGLLAAAGRPSAGGSESRP
jgi:peptide/nickel transport system ATP-binding protein